MSNGLQRLGQAARKLFGVKKKVNISDVNKEVKNTPTINNGGRHSGGYRPSHDTPGATGNHAMQTISPIVKGYKCGRGFLTESKFYKR